MNFFRELESKAATSPDSAFFSLMRGRSTEYELTYAAFNAGIRGAAAMLRRQDVEPGDVVLIFAQHSVGMLLSFFGAQYIGAIPSFMPPPTMKQDMAHWLDSHKALLERIQPAIVVSEPACMTYVKSLNVPKLISTDAFEAATTNEQAIDRRNDDLDAVAFLQHSSGTTGLKKGVMVTYRQLFAQLDSYGRALGINSQKSSIVSWLPLYHDMGLIAATLLPFYYGLPVKIIDTFSWLAEPASLINELGRAEDVFCWLPNFAFSYLSKRIGKLDEGTDLKNVRAVINCSEPCKHEDMAAFAERYVPLGLRRDAVQVCYAMAEYVFAVTQSPTGWEAATLRIDAEIAEREHRAHPVPDGFVGRSKLVVSVGTPIDGARVRIGNFAADGFIDEVFVAGPSVCNGYYRNPDLSERKFKSGWYATGDFGFQYNGQLYVTGRKDDLIIVRGKNMYAHDLEEAANTVDGVKPGRSVAFGRDDAGNGTQQLIVAVETLSTDRAREIKKAVADRIFSKFAITPADILILPENSLVKTTSGKISRADNLKKYCANDFNRIA